MSRPFPGAVAGIGAALALVSPGALAFEEVIEKIFMGAWYGAIVFVALVIGAVYFAKWRDKRGAALEAVVGERKPIHAVAPTALVIECVRTMASQRIGAIIVLDSGKLVGIFTERDALNKVLAAGLDPTRTTVAEVMTRDPSFVSPTTTVGDAMELVTKKRFRHLPVVEDGKVVSVISSGDLTHWLVQGQVGEVRAIAELASRA